MIDLWINKKAAEFVRKFAKQLPGSFDFGEGTKCYIAGYEQAVEDFKKAIKESKKEEELRYRRLLGIVEEKEHAVTPPPLQTT